MKIKMQGSELKKVDIDFLSLVKRGANRAPFKVIKSEDAAAASLAKGGLVGAVQKFFRMSDPSPSVAAVFVEKSALAKAMPNLAEVGFKLDDYEIQDDCVVFKQEGFAQADQVIMLKSEEAVGFVVADVANHANLFCGSLDFDPNVAKSGFYPGINEAMKAMQVAVNVSKGESDSVLKSFQSYVAQLSKALPESVAKFESLQRGFGGGTTGASEVVKAASDLAEKILKGPYNGGRKTGAHALASEMHGSESNQENANSAGSTTSELPGSSDDSPDDDAAKKALMAKGANDTTSSESVGEDEARKANGTDTSESSEMKNDKSSTTTSTTTSEMMEKSAKPVVMKGADGKEYHLAVNKSTGKVIKYTPGAKIPEGHTTMTEEWEQDGSNGNFGNENGQGMGKAKASETSENEVNHTGAGGDKGNMDGTTAAGTMKKTELETLLAAVATLPELVKGVMKSVEVQGELLKKTNDRLEAVEKTALTAIKKADGTVVHVGAVHDAAFENLGGGHRRAVSKREMFRTPAMIAKAEYPDELWGGSLGVIEHHIPGEGD